MNITPIRGPQLSQKSFTSIRKNGQTFDDFAEYNDKYQISSQIQDLIKDENCIGEGRSNKVYKLPYTENFLLKCYKKLTPAYISEYQSKLSSVPDVFTDINVGQAVARMGSNILFLINQEGVQHSIPYTRRKNISDADIMKYLSDMKKLSMFSEDTYLRFVNEIKMLLDKNCYIDYFNSNNLMLTDSEINIVDIVQIKNLKQRVFMFPSKESIMKILVDENVLPFILSDLSKEKRLELGEYIKIIEDKVVNAMKESNLPENKFLTAIIDFLSDNFHNGQNKRFKMALKSLK